jgi:threonine dehydrogenase-like Zn-dependent dehydrogenase
VVRVPDEVPDAVASASSCALRSVVHAFDRLGPMRQDTRVVIQGAGALGLFALALALAAGVREVTVVGAPAERLEIARGWGATNTIDLADLPDPAQRVAEVRTLMGDRRGADVVIEVSGVAAAFSEGVEMLRPGGRYVVVGPVDQVAASIRPGDIVLKQLTILGSVSATAEHYHRALGFVRDHRDRFSFGDVVSGVYEFADINLAMTRMMAHEELKAAIRFAQ